MTGAKKVVFEVRLPPQGFPLLFAQLCLRCDVEVPLPCLPHPIAPAQCDGDDGTHMLHSSFTLQLIFLPYSPAGWWSGPASCW
jgi:hypothetical protein